MATAPRLSERESRQYGRVAWDAFLKRRKLEHPEANGGSMSSLEWDQLHRWMEGGVPLRVVVEGIRTCGGKPRTLLYCAPAVEAEWQRVQQAQTA